jgi:predicted  nucleic acid-binding Zn-ribbon protein
MIIMHPYISSIIHLNKIHLFSQADELENAQRSLQDKLMDIEAKEQNMQSLHSELETARKEAEERSKELSQVQLEKMQREQELQEKLQEQLLIRSELHAAHDENDEGEDDDNKKDYGEWTGLGRFLGLS